MSTLGLDRLPELKVLYLHGNDIQRITGLNSCSCLRELVLDKNKIKHIEPSSFLGLDELRELRLQVWQMLLGVLEGGTGWQKRRMLCLVRAGK